MFFSFIALNISYHSLLVSRVLLKNLLIALWEFPYMLFVIFSLLLLIFSLIFDSCHFDYSVNILVYSSLG